MNKIKTLQAVLLITISALAVSCSPGREYFYDRHPSSNVSVSLIISAHPGFVISRYPDGRFYYRSPEGYIYWRGWDNRYYIDRTYIRKIHYDKREYREWRNGGRRFYGRRYY
ncbi:MAG: hypothetical protein IT214_13050 [Chitinophagaceae bacterium]|nr:hypothetical protein [Chitinophagaceae bacterium]